MRSAIARVRSHVVVTGACDIWLGAVGPDAYGRFSVRNARVERIVSPHLVAATLAFGSTLMHDCDVRLCVSAAPGHVRVATQGENMRQAVRRGAAGSQPGLVDVRSNVGAAHTVQEALRGHGDASLAEVTAVARPGAR